MKTKTVEQSLRLLLKSYSKIFSYDANGEVRSVVIFSQSSPHAILDDIKKLEENVFLETDDKIERLPEGMDFSVSENTENLNSSLVPEGIDMNISEEDKALQFPQ